MASSRGLASASSEDSQIMNLKEKLYEQCKEAEAQTVFSQTDLLEYRVIPGDNLSLLLQVAQQLCNEKLFKLVRHASSSAGWVCRSRDDAAKYAFRVQTLAEVIY